MRPLRIGLLALGAAHLLSACGEEATEPAARAPAEDSASPASPASGGAAKWVGTAGCASCHAEAAEAWQGSHHDLAMAEATPETVLGDFDDAVFVDGPTTWTFSRDGERFVATSEGRERGVHTIAYTFGVAPLQQFLIERPGGRLQALHIAWDSRPSGEGGQRWYSLYGDEHVVPGDPMHWQGVALNWNGMCGECHSTRFQKGYDLATNSYASSWEEIDVGCEACHGAGSNHVAWARAGAEGDDPRLDVMLPDATEWVFEGGHPIAQPVGGTPNNTPELDTCAACHSRRARIVDDPRPGEPFLDTHQPALLRRGLYHDDGQVADEVYVYGSFLQSRMYEAGVRCSNCHEPHSATLRAEGNAVCASCHEPAHFDTPDHHRHPQGSDGASCVACHMPAQDFMTIDSRRDHGFRVPRPALSAEVGSPDACLSCHADRDAAWSEAEVADWRGGDRAPHFGERLRARNVGGSVAGQTLISLFDDPTEPTIARATALAELGGDPLSVERIADAAASEEPLLRLAAARAAAGAAPLARARRIPALLDDPLRVVRIEAAASLADTEPSLTPAQRQSLGRAMEEYFAAQRTMADQPSAHTNLALLHERLGNYAEAEKAYQVALRLGDYFVPAYTNLANLLGQQGRDGEGAMLLHQGIAQVPDNADLHFALGLALVRMQQIDPALEELANATRLAPEMPYYAFVYGAGLNSTGRPEEALAVLRAASEGHPNDQNLLGSLATIARDIGRYDTAIEAAEGLVRLFPEEPEAQALLDDIRARRDSGFVPPPPAPPPQP